MANIWIGLGPREDQTQYKIAVEETTGLLKTYEGFPPLAKVAEYDKFMCGWLGITCPDANIFTVVLNLIALDVPVHQIDFDSENIEYCKNVIEQIYSVTKKKIENWFAY